METAQVNPQATAVRPLAEGGPLRTTVTCRSGVLKIVLFFTFAVLVLFGVDHCVKAGLRRIQTSSFGVTNQIVNGQINAQILISGSSRALTHYDPRIIQEATGRSAYNIGINGSQTDMQVAMLRTYLRHNQKPDLLVHNLDLYSFQTTKEIYDPAQYFPYLDEEDIYAAVKRVVPDAWKWKWLPLYPFAVHDLRFTWIKGLQGLVGFQGRETHFQGFLPRHTAWTGDFEKFRDAHREGIDFEIEPQGIEDLRQIGEVCQAQGIRLLFVYSPVYAEMQKLERNREEVFKLFREISDRFKSSLWDYSGSPISGQRDYFYNSQHLNAAGATVFSHDLGRRLVDDRMVR